MLNKKPIFIHGFSRGGSNILVNYFISHPDICISNGETHKVFKGRGRVDTPMTTFLKRLKYDYPIRIRTGQDIFGTTLLENRRSVPQGVKNYIDRILFQGRFKAMTETHNLYRSENERYTKKQLADCRLLTKGLNGIVFTADMFHEMYPDATFFALVRHGLAVCEGRLRRGHLDAAKMAQQYQSVVDKMLINQQNIPNYHIVKYEDMVSTPSEFIKDIYAKAEIDISGLSKVRLESKPIMDKDGTHQLSKGYDHQVFWYDLQDLHNHIKTDINANQISRLKTADRDVFLKIAAASMDRLDYAY